jgi:hypothetical protein
MKNLCFIMMISQIKYDGERRENCTSFWWESPAETDHSKDRGVDGRMDLREIGWGSVDWV